MSSVVESERVGLVRDSGRLEFFNELADHWDAQVATPEFMDRLGAVVEGLGLGAGEVILDLGCGTGNLTMILADLLGPAASIIAVDLSPRMLDRARGKLAGESPVEWLEADAVELPVEAGSVDTVICLSTWPHFPEPARVAHELYRIVRPGGRLHILHLDGRDTINALHHGIGGAVASDQLPPASELSALLEGAGFRSELVRDEADHYQVTAVRLPE